MLIFCCGMVRSGSTVQYQLVAELVESQNLGMAIGFIGRPTKAALAMLQSAARRTDKFLVVKCHEYTPEALELINSGDAAAVYIYRDIRDVAVSLERKFLSTIHAASPNADVLIDSLNLALSNYYGWISSPNTLISRYEEMVDGLEDEVKKIANYLKIEIDQSTAQAIAQKFSLKSQLQQIQEFDYQGQGIPTNFEGDAYHPISQLHNNHIFSGEVNQWKSSLREERIQQIEKIGFSWLADRKYSISSVVLNLPKRTSVQKLRRAISQFIQEKNWEEAADLLRQAILLRPQLADFHCSLGEVLLRKGETRYAVNALRHAISLESSYRYYHLLGVALMNQGNWKEAIDSFKQTIKIQPDFLPAYKKLSRAFAEQGAFEQSIEYLHKALKVAQCYSASSEQDENE